MIYQVWNVSVVDRAPSGHVTDRYNGIGIQGLEKARSDTQRAAICQRVFLQRAIVYALAEGLLSRSEIENGSLTTRQAVAKGAIFDQCTFELPQLTDRQRLKDIHDIFLKIDRSCSGRKDFTYLRRTLAGRRVKPSPEFDELVCQIEAVSKGALTLPDSTWRKILDNGLHAYNTKSVSNWIGGRIHDCVTTLSTRFSKHGQYNTRLKLIQDGYGYSLPRLLRQYVS